MLFRIFAGPGKEKEKVPLESTLLTSSCLVPRRCTGVGFCDALPETFTVARDGLAFFASESGDIFLFVNGIQFHLRNPEEAVGFRFTGVVAAGDEKSLWLWALGETKNREQICQIRNLATDRQPSTIVIRPKVLCALPFCSGEGLKQTQFVLIGTDEGDVRALDVPSACLTEFCISWEEVHKQIAGVLDRKGEGGAGDGGTELDETDFWVLSLCSHPKDPDRLLICYSGGFLVDWRLGARRAIACYGLPSPASPRQKSKGPDRPTLQAVGFVPDAAVSNGDGTAFAVFGMALEGCALQVPAGPAVFLFAWLGGDAEERLGKKVDSALPLLPVTAVSLADFAEGAGWKGELVTARRMVWVSSGERGGAKKGGASGGADRNGDRESALSHPHVSHLALAASLAGSLVLLLGCTDADRGAFDEGRMVLLSGYFFREVTQIYPPQSKAEEGLEERVQAARVCAASDGLFGRPRSEEHDASMTLCCSDSGGASGVFFLLEMHTHSQPAEGDREAVLVRTKVCPPVEPLSLSAVSTARVWTATDACEGDGGGSGSDAYTAAAAVRGFVRATLSQEGGVGSSLPASVLRPVADCVGGVCATGHSDGRVVLFGTASDGLVPVTSLSIVAVDDCAALGGKGGEPGGEGWRGLSVRRRPHVKSRPHDPRVVALDFLLAPEGGAWLCVGAASGEIYLFQWTDGGGRPQLSDAEGREWEVSQLEGDEGGALDLDNLDLEKLRSSAEAAPKCPPVSLEAGFNCALRLGMHTHCVSDLKLVRLGGGGGQPQLVVLSADITGSYRLSDGVSGEALFNFSIDASSSTSDGYFGPAQFCMHREGASDSGGGVETSLLVVWRSGSVQRLSLEDSGVGEGNSSVAVDVEEMMSLEDLEAQAGPEREGENGVLWEKLEGKDEQILHVAALRERRIGKKIPPPPANTTTTSPVLQSQQTHGGKSPDSVYSEGGGAHGRLTIVRRGTVIVYSRALRVTLEQVRRQRVPVGSGQQQQEKKAGATTESRSLTTSICLFKEKEEAVAAQLVHVGLEEAVAVALRGGRVLLFALQQSPFSPALSLQETEEAPAPLGCAISLVGSVDALSRLSSPSEFGRRHAALARRFDLAAIGRDGRVLFAARSSESDGNRGWGNLGGVTTLPSGPVASGAVWTCILAGPENPAESLAVHLPEIICSAAAEAVGQGGGIQGGGTHEGGGGAEQPESAKARGKGPGEKERKGPLGWLGLRRSSTRDRDGAHPTGRGSRSSLRAPEADPSGASQDAGSSALLAVLDRTPEAFRSSLVDEQRGVGPQQKVSPNVAAAHAFADESFEMVSAEVGGTGARSGSGERGGVAVRRDQTGSAGGSTSTSAAREGLGLKREGGGGNFLGRLLSGGSEGGKGGKGQRGSVGPAGRAQSRAGEAKAVLGDTKEKLLENREKLQELGNKTDQLQNQAQDFASLASQLKNKFR
uniref:V-SNARE coiled-coil homology domain-containing protein n=1 Tax=Chromera velia CCMP2878 TaxID=1169474 RepID=A0A0G4GNG1_9ALVE|eukprot:Cvel_22679.t1-p1 / transcript=Cvel_22679.t1 / gene=Cvel_22679 / organism=Chromera_velia_CCMP2878 / gene_product=hypothetical protein / transcript_product=hypothetical protein / location=Cvel_scaffold2256:1895-9515(+) / protein_length=1444 / sequence_SO=supercontig / SO=protein_coding / is_pseudo=false